MKRNILKALVLRSILHRVAFVLAAGVVAIILNAGCEEQQQQQPNSKMARLVAVENNQLKKDLQQRDIEIGKLKQQQHGNELKEQQELLAKCQKEKEDLQEQIAGKFQGQHGSELKEQQELLAKCQKEKEDLQEQMAGKFQGQIDNLMGSVAEQNKNLQGENEALKKEIEVLESELEKREAQLKQFESEPNVQKKPAE